MITRESVADWPMFSDVEVSDVLAISAVTRRSPDQTLRAAGELAAGDLLRDVRVGTILDERDLFLYSRSAPRKFQNRLGRARARLDGHWGQYPAAELPRGERVERTSPGTQDAVVGWIRVVPEDVGLAMEFTRGRPAVCIGVPPGAEAEPILGRLDAGSDQAQILRCAAPAVTAGCVVLRSFGAFDDAEVAAELFISEAEWRTAAPSAGCAGTSGLDKLDRR